MGEKRNTIEWDGGLFGAPLGMYAGKNLDLVVERSNKESAPRIDLFGELQRLWASAPF